MKRITGITTQKQEIYEGKVDVRMLVPETLVRFLYDSRDGKKEVEMVFERVEKSRNPLLSDTAIFIRRSRDLPDRIIKVFPFDVQKLDGINYIDFGDKRTWRSMQYCSRIPGDYCDPKFLRRDEILRRYGK